MKFKVLFISFSFGLNILLSFFVFQLNESNKINSKEIKRIDSIRLSDLKHLETIFKNKISKAEVLNILDKKKDHSIYFDKPSENGIGLGSLFLVFDSKGSLSKIESPSFEGP